MPYPSSGGGSSTTTPQMEAMMNRQLVNMVIDTDRSRNTTYTNDTQADIDLYAFSTLSSTSASMKCIINEGLASEMTFQSVAHDAGGSTRVVLRAIIPVGATYVIRDRDPIHWVEYRAEA